MVNDEDEDDHLMYIEGEPVPTRKDVTSADEVKETVESVINDPARDGILLIPSLIGVEVAAVAARGIWGFLFPPIIFAVTYGLLWIRH